MGANEAAARWRRDLTALAIYGFGQVSLDEFLAILAEHVKLPPARPEAVAEKRMAVKARDGQVSLGWAWVDRVGSTLGALADQGLAAALATATHTDDAGLDACVVRHLPPAGCDRRGLRGRCRCLSPVATQPMK